jgi:hypothetical protein
VIETAEFAHADGQVQEYLHLAGKAAESGMWEKASTYATLARAWQTERYAAERKLRRHSWD